LWIHGRIVTEAQTLADEVVVADLDLDLCRQGKDKMFNFAAHRRPEQYSAITERAGVIEPATLDAIKHQAASRGTGRRS
jgi:hypothetical protein